MSSLAGLKKKLSDFSQKYWFWPFWTNWVHLQSRFSQRSGRISKKSSGNFLGEVVSNIVLVFELSMRGGVAVLQVDIFQKQWF